MSNTDHNLSASSYLVCKCANAFFGWFLPSHGNVCAMPQVLGTFETRGAAILFTRRQEASWTETRGAACFNEGAWPSVNRRGRETEAGQDVPSDGRERASQSQTQQVTLSGKQCRFSFYLYE